MIINGIRSSSKYLYIHGGYSNPPHISPGAAGAGMIRWNPNMNQLEVNDGNVWLTLSGTDIGIDLNEEAVGLLDWVKQKREEESRMAEMMSKYPALKKAKENLDLVWNLVKNEHENQI